MTEWGLDGRVVVVTGAGRGIGRTIAQRFSEAGATVAALDVVLDGVQEFAADVRSAGGRAAAVGCDVTGMASATGALAEVAGTFGGLDVLANKAGINVEGAVEDLSDAAFSRCLDVNVTGVFRVSQAAIPYLKKSGH